MLLARPPQFVVVGTGRCGTGYAARRLSDLGIRCAHEGYYTPDGPRLRNPVRDPGTRGDASWLALPFLQPDTTRIVHLVRRPVDVIRSLYNIGFFDPAFRQRHGSFARFTEAHFRSDPDPFDSCVRWYLEWNARCERLGGLRVQIERFEDMLPRILDHIRMTPTAEAAAPPSDVNRKACVYPIPLSRSEAEGRLRDHPLAAALAEMASRYDYGAESRWA